MRVNDKNLAISAAPSQYVSQMFSSFFKFGHYMGLVPFRTSLTRMSEKSAENRKTPLNVIITYLCFSFLYNFISMCYLLVITYTGVYCAGVHSYHSNLAVLFPASVLGHRKVRMAQ